MSKWQDISAAPKDGTWILVAFDDDPPVDVACWRPEDWTIEGWYSSWSERLEPTHWMPLPEPPEQS